MGHIHRCAHTYLDVKHKLTTVTITGRKIAATALQSKSVSECSKTMKLVEIVVHTEVLLVGSHGNYNTMQTAFIYP